MTFNIGNAIKYCWRAGIKAQRGEDHGAARLRDLRKAQWYLAREIQRLEAESEIRSS